MNFSTITIGALIGLFSLSTNAAGPRHPDVYNWFKIYTTNGCYYYHYLMDMDAGSRSGYRRAGFEKYPAEWSGKCVKGKPLNGRGTIEGAGGSANICEIEFKNGLQIRGKCWGGLDGIEKKDANEFILNNGCLIKQEYKMEGYNCDPSQILAMESANQSGPKTNATDRFGSNALNLTQHTHNLCAVLWCIGLHIGQTPGKMAIPLIQM
jgi:hypothetical protein